MAKVALAKIVLYSFVNCMNISINAHNRSQEEVGKTYYPISELYNSVIKHSNNNEPYIKRFLEYSEIKYAENLNKFSKELDLLIKHGYVKYNAKSGEQGINRYMAQDMGLGKRYEYALTTKGKSKIKELCKSKKEVEQNVQA